jgi:CBS domain-containing protein
MPYQVKQIIEGKGMPVCVEKDDPVSKALELMIDHDFSQLPVIHRQDNFDIPEGMITNESILRGIKNFKAGIKDLKVRDVMITAPIYSLEDDLFDILDRLKNTNAVLITDAIGPDLVGIVTSYDTTEYFRNRTEDLMRVEDIEVMIKELIKGAFTDEKGESDESALAVAVTQVISYKRGSKQNEKPPSFTDLSLGDYIVLLQRKEVWNN